VLLVLSVTILACAPPSPRIAGAELGTTVSASRIAQPKTIFATTERSIHLLVTVENALPQTRVGAKWYSVASTKRLLFESDLELDPLNSTADFVLTNTNDWIPGAYQVVVFLDGKETQTLNFQVK
jgi:hypothetical protein